MATETVVEPSEDKEEKCSSNYYVPSAAINFDELEAMQKAAEKGRQAEDLTWQFKQLLSNIFYSDDVDRTAAIKKLTNQYTDRLDSLLSANPELKSSDDMNEKSPIKRENGLDYPARDYAYVPDPARPATWKLRLTETPGKVSAAQLARAAAALGVGGFRGQKAQIPATALSAVKRRIRAEYRKLGVAEPLIPASVKKAFTVFKSADGQWRWFAVYSNNFRDRDNPPEIISERSHKSFVALVEKGVVPKPELWHWHVPGSKWGTTEMVGYDNGFAWAAGVIDPGHEKEAESMAKAEEDLGVSHGMPSRFIKRLPTDESIINLHVTSEISPLPGWAAANELTGFSVFEGVQAMTDAQKEYFKDTVGLNEDEIEALANGFPKKEAAAVDAGIERKEQTQEEQPVAEKQTDDLKKEIAGAIGSVVRPLLTQLKEMNTRLGEMEARLAEVEVFSGESKSLTPVASMDELVRQSIIGQPEAEVDGRTKLARSAKPKSKVPEVTPVNFINELMAE